jgi:hypothetical protein
LISLTAHARDCTSLYCARRECDRTGNRLGKVGTSVLCLECAGSHHLNDMNCVKVTIRVHFRSGPAH